MESFLEIILQEFSAGEESRIERDQCLITARDYWLRLPVDGKVPVEPSPGTIRPWSTRENRWVTPPSAWPYRDNGDLGE